MQTAATFSNVIDTLCSECGMAQQALLANTACTTALSTGTDISTICMGTCRNLLNDIISNCNASVSLLAATTHAYSIAIYLNYMYVVRSYSHYSFV